MLKFTVTFYNNAAAIVVNNIAATITRIITEDITLRVFLLFILNIFFTLLSYKTNNETILLKGYYTMKFPFFASFIILIITITLASKRAEKKRRRHNEDFWDKERKANSVRRKSLDDLEYIAIPFHSLPMDTASEDEIIAGCHRDLENLQNEKIVNLTGFSNTDLKLEYGTANITLLSQYDQNYTLFVRAMQEWGKRLYDLGFLDDALTVLEYAIATRTDISSTYYLAASIYHQKGQDEKIRHLLVVAETLQSVMKNSIVRTLKESYPDIDLLHS